VIAHDFTVALVRRLRHMTYLHPFTNISQHLLRPATGFRHLHYNIALSFLGLPPLLAKRSAPIQNSDKQNPTLRINRAQTTFTLCSCLSIIDMEPAIEEASRESSHGEPVATVHNADEICIAVEGQTGSEGEAGANLDSTDGEHGQMLREDGAPQALDQHLSNHGNDSGSDPGAMTSDFTQDHHDSPSPSPSTSSASLEHGPSSRSSNSSQDHQHLERSQETSDTPRNVWRHTQGDDASMSAKSSNSVNSDGSPPLKIDHDALKHLATHFLLGSHGACVDVTRIEGGSYHEIRILTFEDGWTCIGRFTRVHEPLHKTDTELATIEYVDKHTRIPVPKIYFVNHNENHVVGAAFVLMERLEGFSLDDVWAELSMEHRLSVVEQLAQIVGELGKLRFDRIGSLTSEGTVGPFVNISHTESEQLAGPFTTFHEFACATLDENLRHCPEEAMALFPAIKDELRVLLTRKHFNNVLQAPYRLIHVDLENRNILVTQDDRCSAPKITGVIDWDWAFVGPAYCLYEHNEEITDMQKSDEELPVYKKLRQHFVRTLMRQFPGDSAERELIKLCFREKCVELTNFLRFVGRPFDDDDFEVRRTKNYLDLVRNETLHMPRHPYGVLGVDWVPDSDDESDG
jgi:hypothetical protein